MNVGFIGLGNVGGKLAGTLLRNDVDLTVRDLDQSVAERFTIAGAAWAESPADMARNCDIIITCLPSPAACSAVVEGPGGLLDGLGPGKIWVEMSTTDADEVKRLAARVADTGAAAADCPVSGGCHRADTGNISIFAGCDRPIFERLLPVLTLLGRRVLHTGDIGSASTLKVMTNYLATINLVSLCEAMAVMKAAGLDMATTYEAIRISSGTSFVHETESQLILNGARDVGFTLDLVNKDIGLFQSIAEAHGVPLDLSPLLCTLIQDAESRLGARGQSDRYIEKIEEAAGISVRAEGFPAALIDDEPEMRGYEVSRAT